MFTNNDAWQVIFGIYSIKLKYTVSIARLDDIDKVWPVSLTVAAISYSFYRIWGYKHIIFMM